MGAAATHGLASVDLAAAHDDLVAEPYSWACSAVNQRSRSKSAWICSTDLPECLAISSAMRCLV